MVGLVVQMLNSKFQTGDKIGHWTLIKQVPKPPHLKTNLIYWLCQCDCKDQTTKIVSEPSLVKNKSLSCGCRRLTDLTNTYIGKLHILHKDVSKTKHNKEMRMW